jgi:hypothetical protein
MRPPATGLIEQVVTSGAFSLDGGKWDVDNNVWIIGDENEVIVIDAAHDVEKIAQGIGGRRVVAIACTHAHDDHVNQAPALSKRFNAPVLLHPAEAPLWVMTHPDRRPDEELADGDVLRAGGIELQVMHTPPRSTRSSSRSAADCSPCPAIPPSAPGTATPPPLESRHPTSTSGSPDDIDVLCPRPPSAARGASGT